jgi:hypothetical protein
MSQRFVIEITFRLNPDKKLEFEQSSEDLICCEGPGHIKTKVLEGSGHTGMVVWTSEWSDRDKLNAYLDGERFKVLMGGIRTLGTRVSLQVGEFPAKDLAFEQKPKGTESK